ncbi:metalloregulator ArsR/SmtB family transcription factor [Marinomonas mediterranea]|jgi:transcriptional regulator, ArsR family|uniref:Regulatory protein ArsR n=1 Tax=Marinomonas mediterranea (strain ATCC 700492 / JCM 21426 / NBRC 103028 / MMB-1) TaxID=717774 RepID=F2K2K1_MARM1|nr:metalloregulator ArsR/SmtB family transcription factor [Marinomonas mediterranea]ADZ90046.1 regulatory protein ArsR [Marinomonas mediterranea MMB-1]WCN08111.1 metalloregulator ArsR/SmtB family transcription factor [Marinomonas mediterranea]WCN12181.1 metalloregulator ArsR/SmtB family transcription factor [Marinomonas mediterranea]WCN16253.1 metalloregulator ArsR/SmtB family transcription factor [Marinomonas mediterranea MMB-1]
MTPITLFKSLADETRLKSILLIKEETELCVCELQHALGESQPKISRHLAQLKQISLLQDRREGKWIYYRLHDDLPTWVSKTIELTLLNNADFLSSATASLAEMGDRPTRMAACC